MSNIAGKSYAMNVITPIPKSVAFINKIIFWAATVPFLNTKITGLLTLSLIHYARWAVLSDNDFPHFPDTDQPKEELEYAYMVFFSNFNGSWEQYVDSFHMAIPDGLDAFWKNNVHYPKSVPLQPFHSYITHNQIWTNHYYNAYPMAASNDVKSAKKLKGELLQFIEDSKGNSPEEFQQKFNKLLFDLQADISTMEPTPIVSLSAKAVEERRKN